MQFLKVITLSIFIFMSNLAFADAEKAKGLLKSKNCLACHAVDKNLLDLLIRMLQLNIRAIKLPLI